ncbi:MAG: hypothetical protein C4542_04820 [Dehalococcoidia bacterium]|nr:MAG: hypothetical protein C4542_04820 [Dehalococcoidia bacterium]
MRRLDLLRRKKGLAAPSEIIVEATIEASLYNKLQQRALEERASTNEVLQESLELGMSDYWLYVMDDYRQDYALISRLFEQYKRDNELLRSLEAQNRHLQQVLAEQGKK